MKVYRAITTTAPGETPESHPEKWELAAFTVPVARGQIRQGFMSEDVAELSIHAGEIPPFDLTDSAIIYGRRYTLNQLPRIEKQADNRYVITAKMEGSLYDLLRAQYLLFDDTGLAIEGDFDLTGNLATVLQLLVNNLNRVFDETAYELGTMPETEVKTHNFNSENCLQVLQRVIQEYEKEFDLVYNEGTTTIIVGEIGSVKGFSLQYGQGKGLYRLERQAMNDKNVFTRLFAYGSDKNLPSDYRDYSRRLKLPLNDESVLNDLDAQEQLGITEHTKIFENIYPHRLGTLTGITDKNTVIDTDMDFDLNDYLVPGVAVKLHFNTGNLAGYSFDLVSYNHGTKTFKLKSFTDDRGEVFPGESSAFQPAEGDKYVLLDLFMPQSYIDAAEAELQERAGAYLEQGASAKAKYACQLDPIYCKKENISLAAGDYIPLKDTALGIDKYFRVLTLTRDIIEPFRWTVDLGDEVKVDYITRLFAAQVEINKLIVRNNMRDPEVYRNSWRTTRELMNMVFDQDNYFDMDRIRPLSVETGMLSVGSKAGQFVLNGVVFQPNYNAVANRIVSSGGTLSHYAIESTIRTWNVAGSDVTIPDNGARYIYIRCEVSGTDAEIRHETDQILVDGVEGYYTFLVGVLHSVNDGYRVISLTYGSTTIVGNQIRTGRITSNNGETYFDLDEGEFKGVFRFTNGQNIQDALTSKTKTFIVQPTAPYYVGDTWVNEGVLYHCITERLTGSFNAEEWTISVEGGESVQTVIDGGIVTTGRIELGDSEGNIWAGIHGGGVAADSIRFWAGNTYANRATAPFRVQQDGKMFATSGEIAGWVLGINMLEKTVDDSKIELDAANQRFRFLFQGQRKVEISTGDLPNLTTLLTGNDTLYNTQTYSQLRAGYTSASFTDYSSIFTINSDFSQIKSNLRIRYTPHPYAININASIFVTVYLVNTSNTVIATLGSYSQFFNGTGDIVKETAYLVSNIAAGSYKLRFSYDIVDNSELEFMGEWQSSPGDFLLGGDAVDSSCTVKSYDEHTMLGKNGLVAFKNPQFHFLLKYALTEDIPWGFYNFYVRGNTQFHSSHSTDTGKKTWLSIRDIFSGSAYVSSELVLGSGGDGYIILSGIRELASHPGGYKTLYVDSSNRIYKR